MASGFIALPDGRMFAGQSRSHDAVLRAIADQLEDSAAQPLRRWILEQLPGPDDVELGYAWVRVADREHIVRSIDLRQMTVENQRLFCEAAKKASVSDRPEKWLIDWLDELADMITRYERGEPPLSRSHTQIVIPEEEGRIGPGWEAE